MSQAKTIQFLQDVFQMTAIVLMTHLNWSSELVNHPDTLIFQYGMNHLTAGHN